MSSITSTCLYKFIFPWIWNRQSKLLLAFKKSELMAELPLKSISFTLNTEEIGSQNIAVTQRTSNSLKRKASSLDLCCDVSAKENLSNATVWDNRSRNGGPFTVSIEGNIGSGKSTLLKYFSTNPKVATYQEPIQQWTDLDGYNLLGKLYDNPKRWSFLFQSFVQLTRLQIHMDKAPNMEAKLIERSFHNNRYCFLESAYESGELTEAEFNVLKEYYDFFLKHLDIDIDLIVYLRTSPEVVYERMKKRGRTEEADVSLEYLKKVHFYYDRWLMESKPKPPPAPVLVINGDLDMETLLKEYETHTPYLLGQKILSDGYSTESIVQLLYSRKKTDHDNKLKP